jgi:PAS domain S-box-containing protein
MSTSDRPNRPQTAADPNHESSADRAASDQARLRAILDTALDAIITIDSAGTIESINPAGEKLFGYAATELLGKNVSVLMPSPDRERHDEYVRRYLDTGERHILGIGREVRARRKDGSVFPADLAVSEMTVGGRRMFTGVVHDVTRRKQYESDLIHAREAAEKASRAKSEFLSNMSHELRTPLHSIIGFAQLLQSEDPPLTAPQRESAEYIVKSGNILLELINELLDLSRVETGRIPLSIEPVPLQEIIESAAEVIRPMLAANKLEFAISVPGGPECGILADYMRAKQVLLNLLSNANKYNRPGGSISVVCEPRDDYTVRVSVRDTGIGIPAERQSQLFTPFNRLGHENGLVQGAGIGLVITKRLVELMGGHIGFESEPGVGSTFWVEFPPARIAVTAEPASNARPVAPPGSAGAEPKQVLYIEDNPANLRLMERLILTRAHTQLLAAADPGLGLQLAREHRPDLILLDINLPDMDGYEVLTRLRGDAATQHIPVIAVTANALPRDAIRAAAANFDGYVTKPIDVSEFLKLYDAVLARSSRTSDRTTTEG